jgi:hypothetical protein
MHGIGTDDGGYCGHEGEKWTVNHESQQNQKDYQINKAPVSSYIYRPRITQDFGTIKGFIY